MHGYLSGFDTSSAWITGANGSALEFDGTNDEFELGSDAHFGFHSNWTMAFWVKTDVESGSTHSTQPFVNYPQLGCIMEATADCQYPSGPRGGGISVAQNKIRVYTHRTQSFGVALEYISDIGTDWNHIVLKYENNYPHLYINGDSVKAGGYYEDIWRVYPSSKFGRAESSPTTAMGAWFEGGLDEIRMYSRAFSRDEIEQLYAYELTAAAKKGAPKPKTTISKPNKGEVIIIGSMLSVINMNGILKIYSINGKKLIEQQIINNSWVDISHLPLGVYFLKMPNFQMKFVR